MAKQFSLHDVKEFARQCSNWGKWRAEDELDTINYITPQKVRQAAQLVKKGKVISLAIPFDSKGPHTGLLIGEIFDLEELAADCAQDGGYEFLFVAPPLPVSGAVGSPINPQAIK
jgi:hypothetical protein